METDPFSLLPAGPTLEVLVVEDNPVNQHVLVLLLEHVGCKVTVVPNGLQAVETHQRQTFDIVLMDIQMPVMDGVRATKLIRAQEKVTGKRVPIIAVTANSVDSERQRCLGAGMDAYLCKPVHAEELFPLIARYTRTHSNGEVSQEASNKSMGENLGSDVGQSWLDALLGLGFDKEAQKRLVGTFLTSVPDRLNHLRQALDEGNKEQLHRLAHSIKGTVAVFGVKPAVDVAFRLEQSSLAEPLTVSRPLGTELLAIVERLLNSMRSYLEKEM